MVTRKRGSPVGQLQELAHIYGVQTSYYDVTARRRHQASPDALLAVLRALGTPIDRVDDVPALLRESKQAQWQRRVEPVVVAWEGQGEVELRLPSDQVHGSVACYLQLETGDVRRWNRHLSGLPTRQAARVEGTRYVVKRLTLPEGLPWGYHRLKVETKGKCFDSLVIAAPLEAYVPTEVQASNTWGVFLPLHALHSRKSWGSGDFSDLEALMEWVSQQEGSVVATLPFLAAFPHELFDPSPYAPVSKLFWNEFYLDVTQIPELQHCPAAQTLLASPTFIKKLESLRASSLVDYRRGMAMKRKVLEELAQCLLTRAGKRLAAFRRFGDTYPILQDYARFRAACERRRASWRAWPEPQRDGVLQEGDYDEDARHYHLYVQWLSHQQLQSFAQKAREKGAGLYLDFPLGVHLDGYDVWRHRGIFAQGISGGAPPNSFFTKGQNWGFPPLHPEKIREQGYNYFVACIRHHLQYARILRIDHVMGLHRLFWIPHGMKAIDGVYVRYTAEEFYAILALESRRLHALIVGEDLGTVPRYVRPTMARHRVHRAYVVQYELRPNPRQAFRRVPSDSFATMNTHDMPTFASFWKGNDIQDRVEMGLLDEARARWERKNRLRLQKALVNFLKHRRWLSRNGSKPKAVLRACLAYLGASRARTVILNLEDLWMEREPQNVPGTGTERPNWRRKTRYALEDFCQKPDVLDTLKHVNSQRSM